MEQKVIDEIKSLKDKNSSLWRIYGLGLQAMVEGLIFEKIANVGAMNHLYWASVFICRAITLRRTYVMSLQVITQKILCGADGILAADVLCLQFSWIGIAKNGSICALCERMNTRLINHPML